MKIKIPKTWKTVFNGNLVYYETKDEAARAAEEAGYPFFAFKGRVYDTLISPDFGDMGVDALAGDVVCKEKDLK